MMTDQMTLAERLAFHKKAFAPVNRDLEHGIEHHMRIARFSSKPHMKEYHVSIARLQNHWLMSNRRTLRNMGQEQPRTIPKRKPYVPKRPGESGFAKAEPHALTPLAVAVSEPDVAPKAEWRPDLSKATTKGLFDYADSELAYRAESMHSARFHRAAGNLDIAAAKVRLARQTNHVLMFIRREIRRRWASTPAPTPFPVGDAVQLDMFGGAL